MSTGEAAGPYRGGLIAVNPCALDEAAFVPVCPTLSASPDDMPVDLPVACSVPAAA